MTCAEFDRWLEGEEARMLAGALPPSEPGALEARAADALAHTRACPRCAESWSAARAVETALLAPRREIAVPPADFVARVMSRVDHIETAAANLPAASLESRPAWLWLLAADPVAAVSATLALVVALALAWRPTWFSGAAAAIAALPSHWLHAASLAGLGETVADTLAAGMDPTAWIGVGLAAGLAGWCLFALYRRAMRDIVLLGRGRSV